MAPLLEREKKRESSPTPHFSQTDFVKNAEHCESVTNRVLEHPVSPPPNKLKEFDLISDNSYLLQITKNNSEDEYGNGNKISKDGDVTVLEIQGPMNINTSVDAENCINQIIEGSDVKLLIDLRDTTFVSSSGLRVFLATSKK